MASKCCNGRECKLGWGFNESADRLIPVKEESADRLIPIEGKSADRLISVKEESADLLIPVEGESADLLISVKEESADLLIPVEKESADRLIPVKKEPADLLIPVKEESANVTSTTIAEWYYLTFNLSSDFISYWSYISLLLEPSCRKALDFQIIFDADEYCEVNCCFLRQKRKFENPPKYPLNCGHFVQWIEYGVDLKVQFPKTGFPTDSWTIDILFEKRKFNEIQKKTKCKVLINYDEIKEMTLEELIEFMNELKEEENSQYDIPIRFGYEQLNQKIWKISINNQEEYKQLNQKIREISINNQDEFGQFLSYLYVVYRKIEMKMEKTGCQDVLPDMESEDKSFDKIDFDLKKAKNEYKSMNKNDFFEMYPVLKKLFFCYIDYIRYSVDYGSDMDEGDDLPGILEEMKLWLQKLNKWSAIK